MSHNSSRKARVLRAPDVSLSADSWHLKLPFDNRALLWWEVLSARKVRLAAGSRSIYFVAYERGDRLDTILTLFQAGGDASEFGAVLRERVELDPDEFEPTREALVVAVDEVAERLILVYLRARPTEKLAGVAEQRVVLRHVTLCRCPDHGADLAYESTRLPVPASVPTSRGHHSLFNLCDVLFCKGDLLLSATFKTSGCGQDVGMTNALFVLKTRKPAKLDLQLASSLTLADAQQLEYFLSHHTYKSMFITALGALQLPDYVPGVPPWVIEPVVLPVKRVQSCTVFAKETSFQEGQAALAQVIGRQSIVPFTLLGARRKWLLVDSRTVDSHHLHAIRGWHVRDTHVLVVRKLDVWQMVQSWANETLLPKLRTFGQLVPLLPISLRGSTLLVRVQVELPPGRQSEKHIYLARINLNPWLPKPPLCFACRITKRPSLPTKIQACGICKARGFDGYPWLFGSRFCSGECLENAWKSHKRLHAFPPLDSWQLDHWKQWLHTYRADLAQI